MSEAESFFGKNGEAEFLNVFALSGPVAENDFQRIVEEAGFSILQGFEHLCFKMLLQFWSLNFGNRQAVHHFPIQAANSLRLADSGDGHHGLVPFNNAAIRIDQDKPFGKLFDDGPVFLLVGAQGFFSHFSAGDIP